MITNAMPKITCVTVTVGRVERLKRAITCYANQTYGKRDMVIVSQGTQQQNLAIRAYLHELGRSDISLFEAPRDINLGTMRNLSIELSTGDVICQWDDDDLYHPHRLAHQYNSLRSQSNRVATAYCDFLKLFEKTGEMYWCDWSGEPLVSHRYLCGTVMFHKNVFGSFRSFYPQEGSQCVVEEDLNVIYKLQTKGEIGRSTSGWHYVYVHHGDNTYDIEHHKLAIDTRWGKSVLKTEQLLENQDMLQMALEKMGLDRTVCLRDKDRVAFTYRPK